MNNGEAPQISAEAVLAVMQREFPTEFRVCMQAAYIEQLEARLREQSPVPGADLTSL